MFYPRNLKNQTIEANLHKYHEMCSRSLVDLLPPKFELSTTKLLRHWMTEVEEWVKANPQVWEEISRLRKLRF